MPRSPELHVVHDGDSLCCGGLVDRFATRYFFVSQCLGRPEDASAGGSASPYGPPVPPPMPPPAPVILAAAMARAANDDDLAVDCAHGFARLATCWRKSLGRVSIEIFLDWWFVQSFSRVMSCCARPNPLSNVLTNGSQPQGTTLNSVTNTHSRCCLRVESSAV
jgi:hypothetical protein